MTVTMLKPHVVAAQGYDPDHSTTLARAMASWFVRLDNSFFDVDDLGHKRSRVDIEQTAVIRFRDEFPAIPLIAIVAIIVVASILTIWRLGRGERTCRMSGSLRRMGWISVCSDSRCTGPRRH